MKDDKARSLKNLRTGLILATIAAALFLGFVLKQYLLSR
ncbi:cytochrome oxidase small assembly protein [Pelomicrobium methylotrophicum]|nr:cytochrome oxidase small assembly protein [Pelomicrobium methylotrophicum]